MGSDHRLSERERPRRAIAPLALAALALAALAGAVGCERAEEPVAPAPRPSASAAPVDRLAPDELEPGQEAAFGLPLPRALKIERDFGYEVFTFAQLRPQVVGKHLRAKFKYTHVEERPNSTVFAGIASPRGRVSAEVLEHRDGTRVIFRLPEPRPAPEPSLSEAERWRRAGIGPDFKPLPSELK